MTEQRKRAKIKTGVVLSDKMDKTIVVRVDRFTKHKLYHRTISRAVKYQVDDRNNEAKVGDRVKIAPTRPVSKQKRWRLIEVLK